MNALKVPLLGVLAALFIGHRCGAAHGLSLAEEERLWSALWIRE
jgi:hypothetical protein